MGDDSYISSSSPIFVGGAPRSGTTLLSVILNTHPSLVCGPETDLLRRWIDVVKIPKSTVRWVWHLLRGWTQSYEHLKPDYGFSLWELRRIRLRCPSGAAFIDRFFAEYARRNGVQRWVDKSPSNVTCLDYLFKHFPRATFVHIIRDGRDACSSIRQWSKEISGPEAVFMSECVELWDKWVRLGLARSGDERYIEVRYESLVHTPEATLKPLFSRLGLEWDESVLSYASRSHGNRPELGAPHRAGTLQPPYTNAIGRWRRDLSDEDRREIERVAGPLLRELGYTELDHWVEESGPNICVPTEHSVAVPANCS